MQQKQYICKSQDAFEIELGSISLFSDKIAYLSEISHVPNVA